MFTQIHRTDRAARMTSAILTSEKLWEFAVRTYSTPGVSDACLTLQNRYGADVNMLLYCCWISDRLGAFPPELFTRATEFSSEWVSNTVVPLRSARTWMKDADFAAESVPTEDCMRVRQEIKTVELESEKIQLQVLESMVTPKQTPDSGQERIIGDAVINLKLYISNRDIGFDEDVKHLCEVVIAAAFPNCDAESVTEALRN